MKKSPDDSSKKKNDVPAPQQEPRRNFFYEAAAVVVGGIVGLVPVGIGLFTFLDPLRTARKKPKVSEADSGGPPGMIRVTSLEALTVGGQPQRFPVIADKADAWNFTPSQPIGAVFIQRTSETEVRVFNATCPHAGCSVSCDGQAFNCPCHNSAFNLDGSKKVSQSGRENPSPRDLDDLVVDAERLKDGEVWIDFKNFYTGKHEKVAKS